MTMRLKRNGLIALAIYAIAKTIGFATPLILSNSLNIHDYGSYEYALNIASICSIFAGFGVSGALPYFLLTRNKHKYIEVHRIQVVLMGSILVGISVLFTRMSNVQIIVFLIPVLTIALVCYSNLAIIFKIKERPAFSSIAEAIPNLSICLAIIFLSFLKLHIDLKWIMFAVGFGCLSLSFVEATKLVWNLKAFQNNVLRFSACVKFGTPLILNSLLMYVFISGPRLVSGPYLSLTEVGVYSFFYRLAAAVLLVHQLVITIFFKKIYQLENNAIDNYFAKIMFGIFCVGLLLFLILPPVLDDYFVLMQNYHAKYLNVYLTLAIQMVIWAATAQMEMIINREKLSSRFLIFLIVIVGCWFGAAIIAGQLHFITLIALCRTQILFFFMIFLAQIHILKSHHIKLHITKLFGLAIFISYLFADRLISTYNL
jgi:O-antigen/teichoic acid export membrane protein